MSHRARRRLQAWPLVAGAIAAAILSVGPAHAASALPSTVPATAPGEGCEVASGQLDWGFKESFRAYISGSIANGAWEPLDGATYETPEFAWQAASGTLDAATLTGSVAFAGAVHFTGHGGLLDTTIANPTLLLDGAGARLLLDIASVPMDAALEGRTEAETASQAPFVDLDLASVPIAVSDDGSTFTGTAIPTVISAEGFDAFGSYETGTPFDPISFAVTVECPEPLVETAEPAPEPSADETLEATDAAETAVAWQPWAWAAGTAAVAVLAVVAVWAVRRGSRRRNGGDAASGSGDAASGSPGDGTS